jgi:AraC family transcriptional regulator
MIIPTINKLPEKKIVGIHLPMSLTANRTGELWKNFMPRRHEIKHGVSEDLISMQIYAPNHFTQFDQASSFTKWSCIEVSETLNIPEGMEHFTIPEGLYATFFYKGSSNDTSIFSYIFGTWLPQSEYILDDRPHFEVLGKNYKNNDINSEEEIWIPIKYRH